MCLLIRNVKVLGHLLKFAFFNILSQIIALWDGIPYTFKALGLIWIKHCHGNVCHMPYL